MKVAVCVCTYRRPRALARLLASLRDQRFGGEPPAIELVVVDNGPDRSARPVVERWAGRLPWPVRYAVEPRTGIPAARNRSFAEAPDDADVVALIDDDDYADAGWLRHLLDGLERYGVDVVTGPQVPVYGEDVPGWVARGGFFEGRRRPTGSRVRVAYTHNVAFRTAVLEDLEHGLDEAFTGHGGADSEFFRRAEGTGHEIAWIDEAVVLNPVSRERASLGWLLRRYYRYGISHGRIQRMHDEPLPRRLRRAGKMGGRALTSPLRLAVRLHRGRSALAWLGVDWAMPAGYLLGWLGARYEEYPSPSDADAEG